MLLPYNGIVFLPYLLASRQLQVSEFRIAFLWIARLELLLGVQIRTESALLSQLFQLRLSAEELEVPDFERG